MSSGTATITASALNVRSGAGTTYGKLGMLYRGATTSFDGEVNGWLRINYQGQTGYISKQYTSISGGATSGGTTSGGDTATTSGGGRTGTVTASALNVRSGSGTNYGVIGSLYRGDTATVVDESNGWYKINYGSGTGWVCGSYLKVTGGSTGGSSTPAPAPSTSDSGESSTSFTGRVTASALNVRSGAGTNYGSIGMLYNGATVTVIGSASGWYKINYGSGTGWVCGEYISRSTSTGDPGGAAGTGEPIGGGAGIKPVDYKQYQDPWGPMMYSNHNDTSQTYRSSACGPTSAADIIATKVNSAVTPYTLGQLAVENGYRTYNDGTAWGFFPYLASKYGLSCTTTTDMDTLKNGLANGGYAVCSMGSGYWTSGGHYICVWKYDGSTVYANDPASTARTSQNGAQFKREMKQMWIFK